jgi:hypothetical protein
MCQRETQAKGIGAHVLERWVLGQKVVKMVAGVW